MDSNDQILVSVSVLTYNHYPFVSQCLDGIVSQKTNFLFEILVHDDASTDNTQSIIKEYEEKYPNLIKPIYQKENQYSKVGKITLNYQFSRVAGKYIAICEGDDYWTDPYKLQKQVDFMESNPKCGLLHTNYIHYRQSTNTFKNINKNVDQGYIFDQLIRCNQITTLTVLMRNSLIQELLKDDHLVKEPLIIDFFLWLFISERAEINFIEDSTGVYRSLTESASNSWDERRIRAFDTLVINIKIFFAKRNSKMYLIEDQIVKYNKDMMLYAFYVKDSELLKKSYEYLYSQKKLSFEDLLMYKTHKNAFCTFFARVYLKTVRLIKRDK